MSHLTPRPGFNTAADDIIHLNAWKARHPARYLILKRPLAQVEIAPENKIVPLPKKRPRLSF